MTGIANASHLRVLHTADLHLDRQFSSWGEAAAARRQDLLDTLDEIGNLARTHRVQLVLLAGDQFDRHNPGARSLNRFLGWLDRLDQDGIRVAMISGNHDSYWYEDSVYRQQFPSNTHIFTEPACDEPARMSFGGISVSVYGVAHDHTQQREVLPGYRRRSYDGVHIGLLHCTIDPPPEFSVADRYLPLTGAELSQAGLDYIALGHIHRARTLNSEGSGLAAYSGSPEPLSIDETGPRTVTLLEFNGGPPTLTLIPCGKRTASRETIDCTNLNDEQITARIRDLSGPDVVLRAILTGAPDDLPDVESMRSRLSNQFCYLTITDDTSIVDTGFVRTIEHERTIRGQFVRQLRQRIADAKNDRDREKAELALRLGLIQLEQRSAR